MKTSMASQMFRIAIIAILAIGSILLVTGKSTAQVPQTGCYELWSTTLTVSDTSGASQTLTFGQGLFATNSLDPCDVNAPPPPPAGAFYANWIDATNAYFTDYKPANLPGTVAWTVEFRAVTGGNPITFSWNSSELPGPGTWTLRDKINGAIVNVDMKAQNSFVDPFGGAITQLEVAYQTTRCTITAVASGDWGAAATWNDNCAGVPTAADDVYIPPGVAVNFNGAPASVGTLTIGDGGSLAFTTDSLLTVAGNAFNRGGVVDLGAAGDLSVNGSLFNYGNMRQIKTVASSATFLDIGGYGGLALTANTDPLGSTLVQIRGGQLCDTDDTAIWRCFYVTPTNSAADADITFYFAEEELNASECDTMEAWRSTGGNNWTPAGTLGSRSCASEPYSVSYSGMALQGTDSAMIQSGHTTYALRSGGSPTAVQLAQIQASVREFGWVIGIVVAMILLTAITLLRSGIASLSRPDQIA